MTAAVALGAALLLAASSAQATSLPVRTFQIAALATQTDAGGLPAEGGAAADPSLSADGLVVAFDAPLSSTQREIYETNVLFGTQALVSTTPQGSPASGVSSDPSISADGAIVAFVSTASDLAPGASATAANIYVRPAGGETELVSGGMNGAVANGTASQPVISGNGRYVAFTSTATNLVSGDHGHTSNVFVRDLLTGQTSLVSVARDGQAGDNWSSGPSIDFDGHCVSFDSAATDLPGEPRQHRTMANVFVRDIATAQTSVVSVTSGGVDQDQSVTRPFRQISSISANGDLIAFDSNASNLVLNDTNRSTDVFLRNRVRHTTVLVSENNAGYEGDNDSFAPTVSADGTEVAFESYAGNLAGGGGPAPNVFVRDLTLGTTSVVDVGPEGQRSSPEQGGQLLQRLAVSADGDLVAFESTAADLTHESGSDPHTFLRFMDPAVAFFTAPPPAEITSSQLTLHVGTDDPAATDLLCQVGNATPFSCGSHDIRITGLTVGRHVLTIRAGGPGLLYASSPLTTTVIVRR